MELREKIAYLLSDMLGGDHYTAFPKDAAAYILAIPEIRDALEEKRINAMSPSQFGDRLLSDAAAKDVQVPDAPSA